MASIAGVDLPREKRVEIGLTYIYGIGRKSSNRILAEAKVDPNTRVRDLTDDEVKRISAAVSYTHLSKLYKTVELPDNAATAGALRKVAPYVKVEEV